MWWYVAALKVEREVKQWFLLLENFPGVWRLSPAPSHSNLHQILCASLCKWSPKGHHTENKSHQPPLTWGQWVFITPREVKKNTEGKVLKYGQKIIFFPRFTRLAFLETSNTFMWGECICPHFCDCIFISAYTFIFMSPRPFLGQIWAKGKRASVWPGHIASASPHPGGR